MGKKGFVEGGGRRKIRWVCENGGMGVLRRKEMEKWDFKKLGKKQKWKKMGLQEGKKMVRNEICMRNGSFVSLTGWGS